MKNNHISKRLFLNYLKNFFYMVSLANFSLLEILKLKNIKPKIVVVGSGFGGGTCVKFLSKFSKILDLYLIDKYQQIQTCPFSNLVIGDIIDTRDITFNINHKLAVKFYNQNIKYISSEKKRIFFSDDSSMSYDFLILSPGISFKKMKLTVIQLMIETQFLIAGQVIRKFQILKVD